MTLVNLFVCSPVLHIIHLHLMEFLMEILVAHEEGGAELLRADKHLPEIEISSEI